MHVATVGLSPVHTDSVITNSNLKAELPLRGADITSLAKSEDFGGIYRTEDGKKRDALRILSSHGMNWARLRVWVDPADGYHDKEELLRMAKRIKKSDMQLLVNLHYSDTWADPAHQTKPAAWQNLTFDQLRRVVYDYTYDICNSLHLRMTMAGRTSSGSKAN